MRRKRCCPYGTMNISFPYSTNMLSLTGQYSLSGQFFRPAPNHWQLATGNWFYSYLIVSAGLIKAALSEWKLTVDQAMSMAVSAEAANTQIATGAL